MNRQIKIDINDCFSKNWTKEQKEHFYRDWFNIPEKYTILWENDRIIGAKPDKPMERIEMTITIDKEGNINFE